MSDFRLAPAPAAPRGWLPALLPGLVAVFLMSGKGVDAAPAWWGIWSAALVVCLASAGAAWRGWWTGGEAAMIGLGALAAATGALGLMLWHYIAKPGVMVIAIYVVASSACQISVKGRFYLNVSARWLLGALLGSLAGDTFLMFNGWFIAGLASFLLAHLCYIALFAVGTPWLGSRPARVVCLSVGVAMYVFLWRHGLPADLRVPVAVYVLAIAVMAAQACTRWRVRRDAPAFAVALGACCFMLSDALLATDRFVQPLPWALLWVLVTYYVAQVLIVMGMVRALRSRTLPAGLGGL